MCTVCGDATHADLKGKVAHRGFGTMPPTRRLATLCPDHWPFEPKIYRPRFSGFHFIVLTNIQTYLQTRIVTKCLQCHHTGSSASIISFQLTITGFDTFDSFIKLHCHNAPWSLRTCRFYHFHQSALRRSVGLDTNIAKWKNSKTSSKAQVGILTQNHRRIDTTNSPIQHIYAVKFTTRICCAKTTKKQWMYCRWHSLEISNNHKKKRNLKYGSRNRQDFDSVVKLQQKDIFILFFFAKIHTVFITTNENKNQICTAKAWHSVYSVSAVANRIVHVFFR